MGLFIQLPIGGGGGGGGYKNASSFSCIKTQKTREKTQFSFLMGLEVNALTRLCACAGSSDRPLFTHAISTKIL